MATDGNDGDFFDGDEDEEEVDVVFNLFFSCCSFIILALVALGSAASAGVG